MSEPSREVFQDPLTVTSVMGAQPDHRYAIDYFGADGTHLGAIAVEPDFQAAKEWTYLLGIRSGRLPAVTAAADGAVVPLWSEDRGAPYCRGIRVDSWVENGGEAVSCEFPMSYFNALAKKGAWQWIEKGELQPGERYVWLLCAYAIGAERPADDSLIDLTISASVFEVEVLTDPIPLELSRLESFHLRATAVGETNPIDVPVFIAQSVIDQACELATAAGEKETGGVLVGRLHRDASTAEIFVEIVTQIPAKYAEASASSFSFTPETWGAADAAIALRGRHELILGWWHSHPRFCNPKCPEEQRRACLFAEPFFSSDDIHLHRVCFPQAYQIALLISDLPDRGSTPAIFGWRTGMVTERGYSAVP